ncbi:heme/steroid binding domain containing protein [Plasmodium knowlesi strain H]|uniref:Heme/steroid binding domain containing protein n=3 Tax=Plasmodium knowlesi TaxID=5850 RepID=A0A5K1UL86_PLAKH|nr:heme/steroid binding domain containing protein, putative [Plasmodium knowlesi strain H]OTN67690.1 Heme/steroid binding domain containing protein [Plasmodium knowlesi]CAA9990336.1 heme/steroid binding domain containing protein, putative [Plasmodium knowlesi strain H]SBO19542.1 heme/steroid binding domain containing protein [Plasmodium knowlesi strain H]SBO22750.1 heme/steroid binding domain containing protein [Plasmodium knowlesi strain H]VVS79810.1 heme/steroid binding domain containing pro|eukprot:XP_002260736.1 heme/steroid binding domain containing protein [Plasmodium knowlesi strain H]
MEGAEQEGFSPSSEPVLVSETSRSEPTADSLHDPQEGKEDRDKKCDACHLCEDVCFSIFCSRCKIKRKNLYTKYRKYKEHNLRICHEEVKLVLKLNARARAEIQSGSPPDGKIKGECGLVETADTVDPPDEAHPAEEEENKPKCEGDDKGTPRRGDQYDTLKDAIRRSRSLTYSDCEEEERKIKYYNYIKYKQYFTKCEVRRHCDVNDCWVVANGYVYDVTTILGCHPGGINCILKKGGNDVSVDYSFHSKYAQKNFWEPLKIGKIITCSKEVNDLPMGSVSSSTRNRCMMM